MVKNRDAIALLERLGDSTRGKLGRELRFDVVLPDSGAAGPTLRYLLHAEAAGLLAPARAFVPPVLPTLDSGRTGIPRSSLPQIWVLQLASGLIACEKANAARAQTALFG